jgi:hypothetical protein
VICWARRKRNGAATGDGLDRGPVEPAALSGLGGDHEPSPVEPREVVPHALVVVVAAVGDQRSRSAPRPADAAAHGPHAVEQFEERAGVNVTLRYYERRGLLPAPERTQSGHRRYDTETVPVA